MTTILEASHIQYGFGERVLFEDINVKVKAHSRIGIIGDNGVGKTTFLSILAGLIQPEKGYVETNVALKYVPQMKGFTTEKSGGEQSFEWLEKAMSAHAGLLLIDEPTTHLDGDHIEFVIKAFKKFNGSILMVSHDRDFLNQVCDEIWLLEHQQMTRYPGNYDDFVVAKELEERQQKEGYRQYQQKKAQLEKAMTAREVKTRTMMKRPDRMSAKDGRFVDGVNESQRKLHKSIKSVQKRIDRLDKVEKVRDKDKVQFIYPFEGDLKGRTVLRVKDFSCEIGEEILLEQVTFSIKHGDKVALSGKNGSGKTTLIQALFSAEESNRVWWNEVNKVGYFSQNLNHLDMDATVFENVRATSSQNDVILRKLLAQLLIGADYLQRKVGDLSGGEKVKVNLAKVLLSDVQMLVLDEPTNYLDMAAMAGLEQFLLHYEGAVLFVSHDRHFVNKIATKGLLIQDKKLIVQANLAEVSMSKVIVEERLDTEEEMLRIEIALAEVLGKLNEGSTAELEQEFQTLIAQKRKIQALKSSKA